MNSPKFVVSLCQEKTNAEGARAGGSQGAHDASDRRYSDIQSHYTAARKEKQLKTSSAALGIKITEEKKQEEQRSDVESGEFIEVKNEENNQIIDSERRVEKMKMKTEAKHKVVEQDFEVEGPKEVGSATQNGEVASPPAVNGNEESVIVQQKADCNFHVIKKSTEAKETETKATPPPVKPNKRKAA
jgi:hypothetical protein